MSRIEIGYEKFETYTRVAPRPEVRGSDDLKVEALSLDADLLRIVDPTQIDAYADYYASGNESVAILENLDDNLPERAKSSYEAFRLGMGMLSYDSEAHNIVKTRLALPTEGLFIDSLKEEEDIFVPTIGQYLLLVKQLNAESATTAEAIEKEAPQLLEGMRTYLSKKRYMPTKDFDERTRGLRVVVLDELSMAIEKAQNRLEHGYAGQYVDQNIYLGSDNTGDDLRAVFIHETYHHISGHARLIHTIHGTEHNQLTGIMSNNEVPLFERNVVQRVGLRVLNNSLIYSPQFARPGEYTERFRWFNEGVTEKLTGETCEALGIKDYKAYPDEENVVDHLIYGAKDLKFKIIAGAYLEDYDPEAPVKVPKWKQMSKIVTENYGPKFLVGLDKIIAAEGFKAADRYISAMYAKVPFSATTEEKLIFSVFGEWPGRNHSAKS